MSDGITDAVKEGKALMVEWKRKVFADFLKNTPTNLIIDELCKREGIIEYPAIKNSAFFIASIESGKYTIADGTGPARILVVKDQ
jgi:hypothetical protein